MRKVLIIDDNQSSDDLKYFLTTEGYSPIIVGSVDGGLKKINASENLKVVLLNVELSARRGLDALQRIKREHLQVIVIVIGARGRTAREAHPWDPWKFCLYTLIWKISVGQLIGRLAG